MPIPQGNSVLSDRPLTIFRSDEYLDADGAELRFPDLGLISKN
jgi:hypothetical protein